MQNLRSAPTLLPVCFAIFTMLAPSQAAAQGPGINGAPIVLQRPQLGEAELGCPVFMRASQQSADRVFEAGSIVPAPGQGLRVTLTGLRSLKITSAEVVAHALSPKSRAVLTATKDDADVTRTFQLAAKDGETFRSNLWMEGVTAISWIEVKSITYSNGSVWRESETRKCVVRPNPLILISSVR